MNRTVSPMIDSDIYDQLIWTKLPRPFSGGKNRFCKKKKKKKKNGAGITG